MYESFYGLKAKPFRLSPDPRFFFNSKGHKRALAYLRYGVKQGEGFIIVTGDVGTGKTTLVGTLLKSLERENVVAAQIVTTQLQADDLLRLVAAAFGLAYQRVSKATVLRSLEVFFRACVQEGKRVLLVVDEAQGLSRRAIEELRMLSNFQQDGRSLLQSFLLGQKEFRATMRSEGFEQLRQRVIAAYHLKPLGAEETESYIQHRMRRAGWDKPYALFSPDVCLGVHEFAGGVPRRINTLCDRVLLYGCIEELKVIDVNALRAVTTDLVEEQGLGDEMPDSTALASSGSPELAAAPALVSSVPAEAPVVQDQRLTAVENSMSALTDAVRDELAMLRKALEAKANDKPD